MKILSASIVIGPLMLIGALPAAADQSISSDRLIQLAAGSGSTAARDTYAQKARDEMHEWRQKLRDFSEKAEAKGQKEGNAAEKELNAAWTKNRGGGPQVADCERGRLGERQDLLREGIPRAGGRLGQDSTAGQVSGFAVPPHGE
jgi:hypothetical protein